MKARFIRLVFSSVGLWLSRKSTPKHCCFFLLMRDLTVTSLARDWLYLSVGFVGKKINDQIKIFGRLEPLDQMMANQICY